MSFIANSPFEIKTFNAGTFTPAAFPVSGASIKSKNFQKYWHMWKKGERRPCEMPFKELLISGREGFMENGQYDWSNGQGGTRLDLHNNYGMGECGNLEFVVNDGWTMEIYIKTGNSDYFNDNLSEDAKGGIYEDRLDISGIEDGDSKLYVILVGGDKLSIDVCSDWQGTKNFYLKTKGQYVGDGDEANFDDWVIVDIQNIVYSGKPCPPKAGSLTSSGGGGNNGGGDDDDDDDDDDSSSKETINPLYLYGGAGALALIFLMRR